MSNISIFKDLLNSKSNTSFTISITEALDRIKNGSSKDKVLAVRNNPNDAQELKKKLPCILFNGTFTVRNDDGLIEHSGFCILDFDKYPNISKMLEDREKIIKDEFTYACFISPSGNGLKVLFKIPKCNKDEHKLYFKSIEKHFDSDYWDEKNCNLSRVCFESYDPEIYINLDSKVWDKKEEEQGHNFTDKAPVLVLSNEDEIIKKLLVWWNKKYGYAKGNRNNNLLILATAFCDYGVDKDYGYNYIYNNIAVDEDIRGELKTLVNSAYKRGNYNSKYFEDTKSLWKIKQQINAGVSKNQIIKEFPKLDNEAFNDIKKQSENDINIFWDFVVDDNGKPKYQIDPLRFKYFLEQNGFKKYYPENTETPILVYVKENIVTSTSVEMIKDFVMKYLMTNEHYPVWNVLAKSTSIFKESYLNMLDSIDLLMLSDTKDKAYIYYRNGVVEVSKDDIRLIKYIDVDGYIWKNQIINRDFKIADTLENDFKDLVLKVSNNDIYRAKSLEHTLGYLMHSYKDKTDQKAIILNDQEINDDPNGGSGKSLMITALSNFKRVVKIDGKSFDPSKSDFVYQRVNIDTQLLAFDDVKRNFNFEQLFSLITEGITVNRKNKDEIFIPFERSPKIIITTNYVIDGAGASHDRRRHEIEFFQYFNGKRSPLTEYGRLLFDQWSELDWNRFDNYMMLNLQQFLNNGLINTISINADIKRFIQQTSKDFYDWTNEGNLVTDVRYYINEISQSFKNEYKQYDKLNSRTFVKWVTKYCEVNNLNIEKNRDTNRYFIITK